MRGDLARWFFFLILTMFPLLATFPLQRKGNIRGYRGRFSERPGLRKVATAATAAAEGAALPSECKKGEVQGEQDGYWLEKHNLENRGISLVPAT